MVLFNYQRREITGKIVYYGPGLCGKTTNLQYIHDNVDPKDKGKMVSLATDADRTLFFDFMPVDAGYIKGMKIKFQFYTVPGQVHYNETRKMVLRGADAVVFVADSQKSLLDSNIYSYDNMIENLNENGLDPDTIPLVIQYNKRDLRDILTIQELDQKLNRRKVKYFPAVAISGEGVMESFREIGRLLLLDIAKKYKVEITATKDKPERSRFERRPKPAVVEAAISQALVDDDKNIGVLGDDAIEAVELDPLPDESECDSDEITLTDESGGPEQPVSGQINQRGREIHTAPPQVKQEQKMKREPVSIKAIEYKMDLKIILQRLKKIMEENYDILERQMKIMREVQDIRDELDNRLRK